MTIGIDGSIGGEGLGRSEVSIVEDVLELLGRPAWMRDAPRREWPKVS